MVFIDIGSSDGEEIEWALRHGYEVHAFEPNPHMQDVLTQRFGANPFVKLNFAAAWNKDEVTNLYQKADGDTTDHGISLIKEKKNVDHDNPVLVRAINIGRYLKDLDEDIDVLKIDAEGAEYIILESILDNFDSKRIKHWFIEDHQHYIESDKWIEQKNKVLERMKGININDWRYADECFELLGSSLRR